MTQHPAVSAMVPLDNDGNEILNKVLPGGEPLVATVWICPACRNEKRGGPPDACFEAPCRDACPALRESGE